MFSKPRFNYGNKTIFAYFTVISCILHLIFIFSSSGLSYFLKSGFDLNDYVSKKGDYVIEIELESGREEVKSEKAEEISKEEEMVKEDLVEKNRQFFVDTSNKITDEEPQIDTNKIGEKGSVAKDMYSGKDNINNEPRLTGDYELLAKGPEELTSVKPQGEIVPLEVGGDIQQLVDEEMYDTMSNINNSEVVSTENESDLSNEPLDESVVQDAKLDDINDANSQTYDIETIAPTIDTEEVVVEMGSFENIQDEKEVIEESTDKKTEFVKDYTEIASVPMDRIIEVMENDDKENVSSKIQNELTQPESQKNNIPYGDDAPFFEDNISNAPIQGEESFNIKKHEYAPYYKHIRDKIRWYWLLQYGTDASINLITRDYSPVIVEFKVVPSGKIVDVEIVDSAGNELLASKIQKSVQNTIMNRFPDYVNEEYINVRFNFYFF